MVLRVHRLRQELESAFRRVTNSRPKFDFEISQAHKLLHVLISHELVTSDVINEFLKNFRLVHRPHF